MWAYREIRRSPAFLSLERALVGMEFATARDNRPSASYATLQDFDWSLRLVLSSSKLSGLRKPLLMLKLEKTLPNGSVEERLLELDEAELDRLLESLKSAQKHIVR